MNKKISTDISVENVVALSTMTYETYVCSMADQTTEYGFTFRDIGSDDSLFDLVLGVATEDVGPKFIEDQWAANMWTAVAICTAHNNQIVAKVQLEFDPSHQWDSLKECLDEIAKQSDQVEALKLVVSTSFDVGEFGFASDLIEAFQSLPIIRSGDKTGERVSEHKCENSSMKIKTADLIGLPLNFAVAKCLGKEGEFRNYTENFCESTFEPSTDWLQGGPIIEREEISIERERHTRENWAAWTSAPLQIGGESFGYGPTPLIAAMRCFVASIQGNEVDIPKELT